jgi:hypothetical protein
LYDSFIRYNMPVYPGAPRETPITKRTACCRPAFIDAFGAPLSASVEFWRRIRSWVGAISERDSLARAARPATAL